MGLKGEEVSLTTVKEQKRRRATGRARATSVLETSQDPVPHLGEANIPVNAGLDVVGQTLRKEAVGAAVRAYRSYPLLFCWCSPADVWVASWISEHQAWTGPGNVHVLRVWNCLEVF